MNTFITLSEDKAIVFTSRNSKSPSSDTPSKKIPQMQLNSITCLIAMHEGGLV